MQTLDSEADAGGFVRSSPWFPLGHAGAPSALPVWGKGPLQEVGCPHPLARGVASPAPPPLGWSPATPFGFTSDVGGPLGGTPCSTQEAPSPAPLPTLPGGPPSPASPSLISASDEKS